MFRLAWDSLKDEIAFDFSRMVIENGEEQPTKRSMLSTLDSLFDP